MSRNTRRCSGFTLVELLVVIAIIGILIALLQGPVARLHATAVTAEGFSKLQAVAMSVAQTTDPDNENGLPANLENAQAILQGAGGTPVGAPVGTAVGPTAPADAQVLPNEQDVANAIQALDENESELRDELAAMPKLTAADGAIYRKVYLDLQLRLAGTIEDVQFIEDGLAAVDDGLNQLPSGPN